jgi:hypothetical protein
MPAIQKKITFRLPYGSKPRPHNAYFSINKYVKITAKQLSIKIQRDSIEKIWSIEGQPANLF